MYLTVAPIINIRRWTFPHAVKLVLENTRRIFRRGTEKFPIPMVDQSNSCKYFRPVPIPIRSCIGIAAILVYREHYSLLAIRGVCILPCPISKRERLLLVNASTWAGYKGQKFAYLVPFRISKGKFIIIRSRLLLSVLPDRCRRWRTRALWFILQVLPARWGDPVVIFILFLVHTYVIYNAIEKVFGVRPGRGWRWRVHVTLKWRWRLRCYD